MVERLADIDDELVDDDLGDEVDVGIIASDEDVGELLPADRIADPSAYPEAVAKLLSDAWRGKRKAVDANRLCQMLRDLCEPMTGVPFEEVTKRDRDPLVTFTTAMDLSAKELDDVIVAVGKIDDIRVSPDVKKKWIRTLEMTKALQGECRKDPAKFWVYVARDDIPDPHASEDLDAPKERLLDIQPFHVEFFDIWTDPKKIHSLIMAPVGHGKSTCLRGLAAWELGHNVEHRMLFLLDTDEKARKTVGAMKRTIMSKRYRSIFPHVHVIPAGRMGHSNSARMFTVTRGSTFAREPSVAAAGIFGNVQGDRYTRIYGDDPSPQEVKDLDSERKRVNEKWNGVVTKRVSDTGSRIRLICTPWHDDDLAMQIAKQAKEGRRPHWRVGIEQFAILDDDDDKAVPIWPTKWDRDYLESEKISPSYDYCYRLKTASRKLRMVRFLRYYDQYFKAGDERDRLVMSLLGASERWISIDPGSGSDKRGTSATGSLDIALARNGAVFIEDCSFEHCPWEEYLDKLAVRLVEAPRPIHGILWEAAGAVKVGFGLWVESLERRCMAHAEKIGRPFDFGTLEIIECDARVGGYKRNMSKGQRVREVAGLLESRAVWFAGQRAFVGREGRWKNSEDKQYSLIAVPGSNIERLTRALLSLTDRGTGSQDQDGIDALTQWLLQNRGRIYKAHPDPVNVTADKIGRARSTNKPVSPIQAAVNKYLDSLEKDEDETPLGEEQVFIAAMSNAGIPGEAA